MDKRPIANHNPYCIYRVETVVPTDERICQFRSIKILNRVSKWDKKMLNGHNFLFSHINLQMIGIIY